ncbi:thiamine pyrophosphate-dependent dehydrogenase E1 component subunit alpha [Anaerotruncus massiliensis (ex Togo et al. 2019)]|uniref:thiamine pyrophosphate-dependent dehydrogenase E1 component subunit alpha n=1 Tax=Anaerotruncus massiliensis (ex Togo et al. 2019) TaxID=1673720 RepID=UPI0027B9E13A|nr:thiamine pyrophosphate-dependent dehydrogenase E1 component subunit alpha [Anaerotruncus massiliensis (ex Togo et al. 2019)]
MSNVCHGGRTIEMIETAASHTRTERDRKKIMQGIPKETLRRMYVDMVRTRTLDEKIKEMLNRGFSISEHSTLGQEAGPIGACAALAESDYIMPYHRGWAWAIGKGMKPHILLAELLGKKTGYNRGKGGPHLGCYELGILGRPGVQAAHLPIAAGVGLSMRMQGLDRVCVAFFGNGASNNANFHEGLNLAGVWKAPVIYFCENNLYQITCTMEETTACEDIADRAVGYGMPGYIVDGNDAIAVYDVTRQAVERARAGKGPTLIETKTYRWEGHNPIDRNAMGGYRTLEEIEEWKQKCPIRLMEESLLEFGCLKEAEIAVIKADAVAEMEKAAQFAIESPYPEREEYYQDVYAD